MSHGCCVAAWEVAAVPARTPAATVTASPALRTPRRNRRHHISSIVRILLCPEFRLSPEKPCSGGRAGAAVELEGGRRGVGASLVGEEADGDRTAGGDGAGVVRRC